ncbi:DgyrCDS4568 [Dimorphilus gyrociliatus]|uniref:DgyrCDS4568 n=1 Tax=Dimorphilus gyrociliatus TaxID=2664684 RepID=A0A7I8VIU3_9ANNE|nr:DgyrCDS4568 [Dimorphilus gyrociliatus]
MILMLITRKSLINILKEKNCVEDVQAIYALSAVGVDWAYKMTDSWFKDGEIGYYLMQKDFGNFAQCKDVKMEIVNNKTDLEPKFCRFSMQLGNNPALLSLGLCLPSSCTTPKNNELLRTPYNISDIFSSKIECEFERPFWKSKAAIAAFVVSCIFFLLVLIGTFLDLIGAEETAAKFFICFSFKTNANNVLNTQHSKNSIQCLHGIRAITIMWVVLGHTYSDTPGYISNILQKMTTINNLAFQAISAATVSVDTFFVLSGFLTTLLFLINIQKLRPKVFILYYLHRVIRLTPVFAIVLMIEICFVKFIPYGPYSVERDDFVKTCESSWWKHLLFIHNFFSAKVLEVKK